MYGEILVFTDFVVGLALLFIAMTVVNVYRARPDVYPPKSSLAFVVILVCGCLIMAGVVFSPSDWVYFRELAPSVVLALCAVVGGVWLKSFFCRVSVLPTNKALGNEEGSRRTLEAIIDAAPIAIIQSDMNGIVTLWNQRAEQIFGWSASEALGTFMPIILPEDRENFRQRLASQLDGVKQKELEKVRLCKDNRRIPTALWTSPVFDDTNQPVGVIGCLIDISDRKQVEQKLREAKEFAEQANETKSAFLAKFSHELRTPLTAILGYNELLCEKSIDSDKARIKYTECIRRNGSILRDLIEDILDISSIEADRINIRERSFLVKELIDDIEAVFKIKAKEKNIEFNLDVTDAVANQVIHTDETRLRQVLMNLVGNAIKFTECGQVHLGVKYNRDRKQMSFVVQDSGLGIPKEAQGAIFQPFVQVDKANRSRDLGVGLGLPLSRQLARLMGGDVDLVVSRVGQGSTFELTIDVGDLQLEKVPAKPKPKEPADFASALGGQNILVVEDNQDLRELIQLMLSDVGAVVQTAKDGQEGVEKALSGHWDVVLMDIHMPRLNGYEAVRSLKQKGFDSPVIALTASAMSEQKNKAMASGYDGYVAKPVYLDQLLASIHTAKVTYQGAPEM